MAMEQRTDAPAPDEHNDALEEVLLEVAELRALPAVAARVIEIAGGE